MFPFKFELIEAISDYYDNTIKNQGSNLDQYQMEITKNRTLVNIPTKILSYYQMYLSYEDNKSVIDHVRLHKLHHYNNKLEQSKKELIENVPQILTVWTQYDDVTDYFSVAMCDVQRTRSTDRELHLHAMKYISEKYPQHSVRN